MSESVILARTLLAIGSLPGVRVSRNNQGAATDRTGRLVRYGVFQPGGSDVLGWRSATVTEAMVGAKVAIFVALEVKSETGRVRPEQAAFIRLVQAAGGIAGVVRSAEDALNLLGAPGGRE